MYLPSTPLYLPQISVPLYKPHPQAHPQAHPHSLSLSLLSLSVSVIPQNPSLSLSTTHTSPQSTMKRLLRRLSRVADSSQYQPLCGGGKPGRRSPRVPEGHVPVHVGDEMERFAVRAELLSRPGFVDLLSRSAQEYGYEQAGVLRIPCPVPLFRRLLDCDGEIRVGSDS